MASIIFSVIDAFKHYFVPDMYFLLFCFMTQVEGEIDKLAMEEAGFHNCVSVPDGAPPKVSSKDLPPEEQV